MQFPIIVHWEQNHFVVIYKVKKTWRGAWRIYVADPAKGLITYDKEEFCQHWVSTVTQGEEKGIALLLEPTEALYTEAGTLEEREKTIQLFSRSFRAWLGERKNAYLGLAHCVSYTLG